MTTEWMTLEEAAEYLRLDTGALKRYINSGLLKAYKLGRKFRFKREELDASLEPCVTVRELLESR